MKANGRTLLTGDLHLTDNPRDSYRLKFFDEELPALVNDEQISCVVILGDITEDKDEHRAALVNAVADSFARLSEMVWVVWLLGNHDYIDPAQPFFRAVASLAGVEVVTRPVARAALCAAAGVAWGPVCLLPHTRDWDRDWQKLRFDAGTTYFAHNTFAGAVSEHGKELPGIPTNIFPEGTKVWAGDVHVPQTIGPVTYVGAPYTIDFGDHFKPRVVVLDADRKARNVMLSFPGKQLVEITSAADLKKAKLLDGDVVKVKVRLRAKDYAEWPKLKGEVEKWAKANDVNLHMVVPDIDAPTVAQRIRDPHQTDEELLEDYGKHHGIDKATLRTGKLLMEEV